MQFEQHAIILAMIDALRRHGSWTGKTHLQKSFSLLRDSGRKPAPFAFVIYKHGPYSFDLQAELEQMRSYGAISVDSVSGGFGVVIQPDENAALVMKKAPLTREQLENIDAVAGFVGKRNVSELERLATASWIRVQEGKSRAADVAKRLNELKPHVPIAAAEQADKEISAWLGSATK